MNRCVDEKMWRQAQKGSERFRSTWRALRKARRRKTVRLCGDPRHYPPPTTERPREDIAKEKKRSVDVVWFIGVEAVELLDELG